jgi:TonB family protein
VPQAEITEAQMSVEKAKAEKADEYAPVPLKVAQDSQAALDAELKAQDAKWVKSYDRARDLALSTKKAGDDAASEALAAKGKAEETAKRAHDAAVARAKIVSSAVRVGGHVRPPVKVKDVKPVYPAIARDAHVSGRVEIEATVDTDGKVVDTHVTHSVPLLDQAALDAVRQWEYRPSLLNGKPTPVTMMVNVNFARP